MMDKAEFTATLLLLGFYTDHLPKRADADALKGGWVLSFMQVVGLPKRLLYVSIVVEGPTSLLEDVFVTFLHVSEMIKYGGHPLTYEPKHFTEYEPALDFINRCLTGEEP
jgi:hypothetical protein